MKLELSPEIFEDYSDMKCHERPFIGSLVIPCVRADRRTFTTKLLVAFRNFAKSSKNRSALPHQLLSLTEELWPYRIPFEGT